MSERMSPGFAETAFHNRTMIDRVSATIATPMVPVRQHESGLLSVEKPSLIAVTDQKPATPQKLVTAFDHNGAEVTATIDASQSELTHQEEAPLPDENTDNVVSLFTSDRQENSGRLRRWRRRAGVALAGAGMLATAGTAAATENDTASVAAAVYADVAPAPASTPVPAEAATDPDMAPAQIAIPEGYSMVWNEEFEGNTLDTRFWNVGTPWGGNFCQGEENFVPNMYELIGGVLHIHYMKRPQPIKTPGCNINRTYDTTFLQTKNKMLVGPEDIVEFKIKGSKGQGTWDIAMIMPNSWPEKTNDYEIDGYEHLGKGNAEGLGVFNHLRDANGQLVHHGVMAPPQDYSADYHVTTVDWRGGHTTLSLDGAPLFQSPQFAAEKDNFITLNGFMGTADNPDWAGAPDASTPAMTTMFADYVRVFRPVG